MSETDMAAGPDESGAPVPIAPAVPSVSAGTLIREAREAAGVTLPDLAGSLKVSLTKLTALEADQFDQLPDPMFVRALASSVCRSLRIDPQPILDRLPASAPRPLDTNNTGLNTPFRPGGGRQLPDFLMQGFRPWVLGVAVLLVGTLLLVFLPLMRGGADNPPRGDNAAVSSQGAPLPVPAAGKMSSSVVENLSFPSTVATSGSTAVAVPVATPSTGNPLPTGVVVSAPVLTSAATLGTASEGLISFRAGADSWVEVKDSAGRVPLRRLLSAGETVHVSGTPPLNVVVGRADGVQVQVRGQAMDIQALAKDNVSRFVVK